MFVSQLPRLDPPFAPPARARFFRFGPFTVDVSGRSLLVGDGVVAVPERLFRLLVMMLDADGGIVRREELVTVWPANSEPSSANLTQHMFLLRRILDRAGGSGPYVLTIPGIGYRITRQVERKNALQMKEACERCHARLSPVGEAFICSYECTYCVTCAALLAYECPNCGGELRERPRRRPS
ncbi:MAG TPA: DUF1272 domain-containing protein [Candidatus Cybelea sp.]|jgi:hypothetical protein|nr:DUF1272 domain-containing protein [Candidatus Cybelea sp.]